MNLEVVEILRIEDGRITERWGQSDQLGMLQQLGALPAVSGTTAPDQPSGRFFIHDGGLDATLA
jgi:hypothetical protein